MTDWTAGSRVKVERAKEHIAQLEVANGLFFEDHPYEVVGVDEPETGKVAFRVKIRGQPPPRMGAIVGDIVHNLRSALDVLITQLYETATGFKAPRSLAFPIYETRHEFESRSLREIKRASEDAVEALKLLKPYKLGNPTLWVLQDLNNRDKHHVLTPVVTALRTLRVDFASALISPLMSMYPNASMEEFKKILPQGPVVYPSPREATCPLHHDQALFRASPEFAHQFYKYTEFTFDIAFGEGEIIKCQPVMFVLQKLLSDALD